MTNKRQDFGQWGEEKASEFLTAKGLKIIKRNYRSRLGEIDIIAQDKECLVFIEVRTKTRSFHGHPLETVNARKQMKLIRMAREYIVFHRLAESIPCRFDVISVVPQISGEPEITHVIDAFRV